MGFVRFADIARGVIHWIVVIGRIEIDDFAQQDVTFLKRFIPRNQRFNRKRAFAQAANHHLPAGFDSLGNRNLTLTREQLHRAHLPQIHAHRVIRAAGIIRGDIAARIIFLIIVRIFVLTGLDSVSRIVF